MSYLAALEQKRANHFGPIFIEIHDTQDLSVEERILHPVASLKSWFPKNFGT